jgi:hypothetical protein
MAKTVAVRDSQMRTTIAQVSIKVAREMVDRNEAEWTGNSRSIRLVRKEPSQPERARGYSHRGNHLCAGSLECNKEYVLQRTGKWYAEVGEPSVCEVPEPPSERASA